jgi:hypothetical protein
MAHVLLPSQSGVELGHVVWGIAGEYVGVLKWIGRERVTSL